MNYNEKKQLFSKLISQQFKNDNFYNGIKLNIVDDKNLINALKILKVIEIDNIEDFKLYTNFDYFLIFKNKNNYYFCDTKMISSLGIDSLIKIIDFKSFYRIDKIKNIEKM